MPTGTPVYTFETFGLIDHCAAAYAHTVADALGGGEIRPETHRQLLMTLRHALSPQPSKYKKWKRYD